MHACVIEWLQRVKEARSFSGKELSYRTRGRVKAKWDQAKSKALGQL